MSRSKGEGYIHTYIHRYRQTERQTDRHARLDILDWTINEIDSIDRKTRKILTMTGNFHKNSDIDRFYTPRKLGVRGIKKVMAAYECRIVSAKQHLTQN